MEGEVKQLESRTLLLAKSASPSITQFNLDPKSQPPRLKVAARVAQWEFPKLRGSEARRQGEGNGRVGWARLAGGRAPNKAAGLPLPGARTAGGASRLPAPSRPGDALAPGTLARAGGRGSPPSPPANSAPSGQWAPSPASRRGDTKAEQPGAEPGVRKVKAEEGEGEGEDGGGRGSPRAAPRPSKALP